jgi:hypothetical protein
MGRDERDESNPFPLYDFQYFFRIERLCRLDINASANIQEDERKKSGIDMA